MRLISGGLIGNMEGGGSRSCLARRGGPGRRGHVDEKVERGERAAERGG